MEHDDTDLYSGSRLHLVHFCCAAWSMGESDLIRALEVISDPKNQPVFVHCQHGSDRTGYLIAGYRRVYQGWETELALSELNAFGYHAIWFNLPVQIRAMRIGVLRERLKVLAPLAALP